MFGVLKPGKKLMEGKTYGLSKLDTLLEIITLKKSCLMDDSDGNFKRKKRPKEEIDLIHKKFTAEDWNFLGELYDEYLIKFHIK